MARLLFLRITLLLIIQLRRNNFLDNRKIMKIKNISQKGFGLIEILLVVGVGMATFLGIEQYLNLSLKAALQDSHQTEALYWAKANLEQARAVRDEDWALLFNLTTCSQYKFIVNNATTPESWEVQTGTRNEGRYVVWFTISRVQRDALDNITAADCIIIPYDSNTFKINSNVSWDESGAAKQISISEYLVNFK